MNILIFLLLVWLEKGSSSGVSIGVLPYAHAVQSLYHAQDNYGQYIYGYITPTSSKSESKTADGVTQGGYSYIDTNGILQTVQYTADPIHGFRVAATNLPKDLPEVAYAKARHLADYEAIKNEHASAAVKYSNPVVVPLNAVPQPVQDLPEVAAARAAHLAILQQAYQSPQVPPQAVQDLPEVVKARTEHLAAFEAVRARDLANAIPLSPIPQKLEGSIVPVVTSHQQPQTSTTSYISYQPVLAQHHSQDNWGQYTYGYVTPHSSKAETRSADGVTRGGYSYIDANGILQTVNYISDAVHGFRVAATNLPVAKLAAPGNVQQTIVRSAPTTSNQLYGQKIFY